MSLLKRGRLGWKGLAWSLKGRAVVPPFGTIDYSEVKRDKELKKDKILLKRQCLCYFQELKLVEPSIS